MKTLQATQYWLVCGFLVLPDVAEHTDSTVVKNVLSITMTDQNPAGSSEIDRRPMPNEPRTASSTWFRTLTAKTWTNLQHRSK